MRKSVGDAFFQFNVVKRQGVFIEPALSHLFLSPPCALAGTVFRLQIAFGNKTDKNTTFVEILADFRIPLIAQFQLISINKNIYAAIKRVYYLLFDLVNIFPAEFISIGMSIAQKHFGLGFHG